MVLRANVANITKRMKMKINIELFEHLLLFAKKIIYYSFILNNDYQFQSINLFFDFILLSLKIGLKYDI